MAYQFIMHCQLICIRTQIPCNPSKKENSWNFQRDLKGLQGKNFFPRDCAGFSEGEKAENPPVLFQ